MMLSHPMICRMLSRVDWKPGSHFTHISDPSDLVHGWQPPPHEGGDPVQPEVV